MPYPHAPLAPHPNPNPAPAAAAAAAPPVRAVVAARIIQIDFGLILKLALGVFFLSRGGGEHRLAFLIACAIAIYMCATLTVPSSLT